MVARCLFDRYRGSEPIVSVYAMVAIAIVTGVGVLIVWKWRYG